MTSGDIISFGAYSLIPAERRLLKGGMAVEVGSRALDVLIALVASAGEVVGQRELMRRAWPNVVVGNGSLRVAIAGLRKALGDGQDGMRYIATVAGRGYCFVAHVERSTELPLPLASTPLPVVSPPRPASTHRLPARLTRMVGRSDAVEAVSMMLTTRRFVSVVAPGGMGKTTVAVSVAHALLEAFGHAVYFVDLGTVTDESLIASTVATALGVCGQTQDSLGGLVAFLHGRRLLLVLDNCEHVIDAAASFAESLHREAPRIHILTTSREALRVEGEHVHYLGPLNYPTVRADLTAAEALATPAVQLFMERAVASGYTSELTDEDAPTVAAICSRLDGIALAIEIAGSQVGAYGIKGTAHMLDNRFKLLWQGRRTALPRHQTMAAMLDWSFNLLSDRDRSVLCRVAIFVGLFTLEAAQAVARDPQIDVTEVADAIATLVNKSLISVASIDGVALYRLLDPTLTYAAEKLAKMPEENAVARQHARYYAESLSNRAVNGVAITPEDVAFAAPFLGNIRAALECSFSVAGEAAVGVTLASAAAPLFYDLSLLIECLRWCEKGLAQLAESEHGSAKHLALQAYLAASMMLTQGNGERVRKGIEAALALADARGDQEHQKHLIVGLCIYLSHVGDCRGALALAQRSFTLTQTIGSPGAIATGESVLGVAYHFIGDQKAARYHCERGLKLVEATGAEMAALFGYDHEIRALKMLARSYWLIGFPDRAAKTARRAIAVATQRDHPFNLCMTLIFAATVFLWRGDLDEAEELVRRLIAHAARHSLGPCEAIGTALSGELSVSRGNPSEGVALLQRGIEALQAAKHDVLLPALHIALAEGLLKAGRSDEAAAAVETGLALSEAFGETLNVPELLRVRGKIWLHTTPADPAAAERSFYLSLQQAKEQSVLGLELRSAISLSRLWANQGKSSDAADLLETRYRRFREGFQTKDLKVADELLAEFGQSDTPLHHATGSL